MTIREALELAAEIVGGNAWGIEKGKPRIYFRVRKDVKAFFDFPDCAYSSPDDVVDGAVSLGGAALKVFIEDCGQHRNWYLGQRKTIARRFLKESLALSALGDGGEDESALARAIMGLDEIAPIVASGAYDRAAGHLANGRQSEARQELGLAA